MQSLIDAVTAMQVAIAVEAVVIAGLIVAVVTRRDL